MLIRPSVTSLFRKYFQPGQVVVVYGPRQVGKTTIVKYWMREYGNEVLWVNGDELRYRDLFAKQNLSELRNLIGQKKILVIDEAQRLPEIGINLKLLVDEMSELKIIVTGSAALELAQKVNEPLTGRKRTIWMYPLNYIEMKRHYGVWEAEQNIPEMLVWGGYPEVVMAKTASEKKQALREIVSSYLYKDILEFQGIRKSEKVVELLRLLAWQIGSEVSIAELASTLSMNRATVEKYLDLLEKSFVIYRMGGYVRNLRKEVGKSNKYYFVDNGVRNGLVEEFKPISMRGDVGMLWENWIMMERKKWWVSRGVGVKSYFWRTYDGQEIDLVEESEAQVRAFEFKWKKQKVKVPLAWKKEYPNAGYKVITHESLAGFVENVGER